jgi:DNA-binding MurR/RpiR family transcriptional regulator
MKLLFHMPTTSEPLLSRIQKLGRLTRSEGKIAEYFRQHHPQIAFETATSISEQTETSKATVVRFISRLGYRSFVEFQNQLQEDIVSRLESPIYRYPSTKHQLESTGRDFLGQNIGHIIKNLETTASSVDRECFMETARMLADEKRQVFIMGQRTAFGVAHSLWLLLRYLRKRVFLISGQSGTIVEDIGDAGVDDVLVVISHRRYSRQTVDTAKVFSDIGAHIIALVDADISPVSKMAEIQMVIPTFGLTMFDSVCATMAFIESLVLAVAHLRDDTITNRLHAADRLFEHFKTFSQKGTVEKRLQRQDETYQERNQG